jgi:hypothetical protein
MAFKEDTLRRTPEGFLSNTLFSSLALTKLRQDNLLNLVPIDVYASGRVAASSHWV